MEYDRRSGEMKDLLLTDEQIKARILYDDNADIFNPLALGRSIAQAQLDNVLNQPWLDKPDEAGIWLRIEKEPNPIYIKYQGYGDYQHL